MEDAQSRDTLGLALIALAGYLICVFVFGLDGGAVGSHVREYSLGIAGHSAYVLPFVALLLGVLLLVKSELIKPGAFRAGIIVVVPAVLLAFASDHLSLGGGTKHEVSFAHAHVITHGGYVGETIYYCTYGLFGDVGTTIVVALGLILSALFLTGSTVQAAVRWWGRGIGGAAVSSVQGSRVLAARIGEVTAEPLAATRDALRGETELPFDRSGLPDIFGDLPSQFARAAGDDTDTLADAVHEKREQQAEANAVAVDSLAMADSIIPKVTKSRTRSRTGDPEPGFGADRVDADGPQEQLQFLQPEPDPVHPGQTAEGLADHVLRARVTDSYHLPEPSLLKLGKGDIEGPKPGDVARISKLLVETFGHFGIESRVVGMVPGPRVSRYELSLAPGTKMSKVENLRKDLSYALATTEIRILAPIPGKSAVGIEVENATPSVVTLGDIYKAPPKDSSPLHVWFGKDISGAVVGADLAKMPHLLVAGTTGAGKSGCMNVILSSLLLGASPDEVKMLLIDPKKVELSSYEGIPHLMTPVVTNMKKAANALGNVIGQMEERYASMEIAGARTLPEYNKIRLSRGDEPVPYVLIVIDELADLVMTAKGDVEDAVIRIAQKGRAAGFHLVVATQRPSVDVITGMIKSNIPSRIAFAVSSQTDSRVILDQNGAETLLGAGDMLFKPISARTVQRVQGAWISESEVRALCESSRDQREPVYDVDLTAEPEVSSGEDGLGAVDEDDRLPEAIRLVAEFQTCSASFFQRRMRVGYTRGARLVDMLERRNVVAPGEGPRPRQVLITTDDVPSILAEIDMGAAVAAVEDAGE